ncbi:MAG: methyltransferase domain-containing protein [Rhodospirillaceae bacterium]|nr:methyltransferase domain-containing protein [Rhodospirillaceae bacterium]
MASARRHAGLLGRIALARNARTGVLSYVQRGGNQTRTDRDGVSLDAYIHALYGLAMQSGAGRVLMIGCAGGTLATMLARSGVRVTAVDIDPLAFRVARRHFNLPRSVDCVTGDGLAYMQSTRRVFDGVVIDAFVGERVPEQFMGPDLVRAAGRRLTADGALFFNVCLDTTRDRTADRIAGLFRAEGWRTRLLDEGGGARNAIVAAGNVARLRPPTLTLPPAIEAERIARGLRGWRFRQIVRG